MRLSSLHRRFTAWLALVALLLGALAPTVTQAMVAGSDRADWLEICTATGMVWVKAGTGELSESLPEGSAPTSEVGQHCPWCTLHGGGAALTVQPLLHTAPFVAHALPSVQLDAPDLAAAWAPAQSRAPPASA